MTAEQVGLLPFDPAKTDRNAASNSGRYGFRDFSPALILQITWTSCSCKAKGAVAIQMMHLHDSPPQAGEMYLRLGYRLSELSYMKEVS